MPIKRRLQKHRFANFTEVELWASTFETGADMLGLLEHSGIGPVQHDDIAEAWRRLGPQFLATRDRTRPEPWAITNLGAPLCL